MNPVLLSPAQLAAIHEALNRGDRVEIIPVKDGVKIMRLQRREIRTTKQ